MPYPTLARGAPGAVRGGPEPRSGHGVVLALAGVFALALGPSGGLAGSAAPLSPQDHEVAYTSSDTVAAGLRLALTDSVAVRWDTPASDVAIAFGAMPQGRSPSETEPPALRGSGAGGEWMALLTDSLGQDFGLRFRAGVRTSLPLAVRRLERGSTITEADIRWEEGVRWGPPEGHHDVVEVGWSVNRVVEAGRPLVQPAVAPPLAVRAGDPVQVLYRTSSLALSLRGVAVNSGRDGDPISVRVDGGGRLRGIARADGVVLIEGGEG